MANLRDTTSVIWRGRWLVLTGLLVGVAIATSVTKTSPRVYRAASIVQVQGQLPGRTGELFGLQLASESLATTYASLIGSESFLARISRRVAGGRFSPSELARLVSAHAISADAQDTNLIQLSADGSSPRGAQALAADVANALVETVTDDAVVRSQQQQQALSARISALGARIDRLSSSRSAKSGAVVNRLVSLRAAQAALNVKLAAAIAQGLGHGGAIVVVAPATAAFAPIRPRSKLNLIVGIALGLTVGLGFAWLRSVLDREVHGSAEVEGLVGLPVLATVPLRRGATREDNVVREAYDVLGANLAFLALDRLLRVITVTSYESGEGKTSTAEGLAAAAARQGANVLLLDGDLRTGALSTLHGAGRAAGFVNQVVLDRSESSADPAPSALIRELRPGMFLLPGGPRPPNPPSILTSPRFEAIVDWARASFDLVVIDSPPIGHLTDGTLLAALSDGVVVVARAGKTKRAELAAAVSSLTQNPTPVLGAVVFEPRSPENAYHSTGRAPMPSRPVRLTAGTGELDAPATEALGARRQPPSSAP